MLSNSGLHWQRGQSSVEFVVLSLVLVPLLLILPLIGKYMDIAQTTALASRYVAFEGATRHSSSSNGWKTDAELALEVRRRFFSNSDAPIKTNDTAGDFNAHRNTLWFDHRGNALVSKFASDVNVVTDKETMVQPIGGILPALDFSNSFGLSKENLYTGRVNVTLANVAGLKPFDALGLTVARSTTLLADPWAASGPEGVRSSVRGSGMAFPYTLLAGEASLLTPFIALVDLGQTSAPDVGRVDPDHVPIDRLGAAK